MHETQILAPAGTIKHPEKYMHAAARRRAGLPPYMSLPSKRTRTRNAARRAARQAGLHPRDL